jgi:hypothetical protein
VKKIAPDPPRPVTGGSSPKCRPAQAARILAPSRQNPRALPSRSAPQARGHSRQRAYQAATVESLTSGKVLPPAVS